MAVTEFAGMAVHALCVDANLPSLPGEIARADTVRLSSAAALVISGGLIASLIPASVPSGRAIDGCHPAHRGIARLHGGCLSVNSLDGLNYAFRGRGGVKRIPAGTLLRQ